MITIQLRNNLWKILRIFLFLQLALSVFHLGRNLEHDFRFLTSYMDKTYTDYEKVDKETVIKTALSVFINLLILPCIALAYMTVTSNKQLNKQRIHLILPLIFLLMVNIGTFIWYYVSEKAKKNADVMDRYQCNGAWSGDTIWFETLPCIIDTYVKFVLSLITVALCCNYFYKLQNTTVRPDHSTDFLTNEHYNISNQQPLPPPPTQLPPHYKDLLNQPDQQQIVHVK